MNKATPYLLSAITLAIIGILAAALLVMAVSQIITTDRPADRVIATEDGTSNEQTEETQVPEATQNTEVFKEAEQAAPTVNDTPSPKPQSNPVSKPTTQKASVVISADGCTVIATGSAGMSLVAGATNGRKGGETTYTLPASGKLSVSVGGIQSFTSYGQLFNTSGQQIASATGTITAASCPAAPAL